MSSVKGRGPTLAKDINRQIIYHRIKQCRETTRVDLARTLGLHKNTVNSIVSELEESGFIQELGQQTQSGAGRKATVIRFHSRNKWAMGAQITSDVIHWAITDLYAQPLESFSVELSNSLPESVIQSLLDESVRLLAKYGSHSCIGMSIGIPALMEESRTRVIRSSHLGWKQVPLLDLLQPHLGIPVQLDNSVKLASLGERWHGRGTDHFVYCYFGNGVGCSLVVDGAVVRGSANASGELGHFVLDPDGPLCGCGKRGCLESLVSLPAIMRMLPAREGAEISGPHNWESVIAQVQQGDPLIESVLCKVGRTIGQALSYVVNLMNPRLIVCDGPLMRAAPYLIPQIESELRRLCLPSVADVHVVCSDLYPFASCIGAAAEVIRAWEAANSPN